MEKVDLEMKIKPENELTSDDSEPENNYNENDSDTEIENDSNYEIDSELLCKCCNLIEYETEETINFIKPLDNETLTKYIYRLNREISDLHKEIVNLHIKIDSLIR